MTDHQPGMNPYDEVDAADVRKWVGGLVEIVGHGIHEISLLAEVDPDADDAQAQRFQIMEMALNTRYERAARMAGHVVAATDWVRKKVAEDQPSPETVVGWLRVIVDGAINEMGWPRNYEVPRSLDLLAHLPGNVLTTIGNEVMQPLVDWALNREKPVMQADVIDRLGELYVAAKEEAENLRRDNEWLLDEIAKLRADDDESE